MRLLQSRLASSTQRCCDQLNQLQYQTCLLRAATLSLAVLSRKLKSDTVMPNSSKNSATWTDHLTHLVPILLSQQWTLTWFLAAKHLPNQQACGVPIIRLMNSSLHLLRKEVDGSGTDPTPSVAAHQGTRASSVGLLLWLSVCDSCFVSLLLVLSFVYHSPCVCILYRFQPCMTFGLCVISNLFRQRPSQLKKPCRRALRSPSHSFIISYHGRVACCFITRASLSSFQISWCTLWVIPCCCPSYASCWQSHVFSIQTSQTSTLYAFLLYSIARVSFV